MATEVTTYECEECGDTFEGDRWEPDYPDTYCCKERFPDGHVWAEYHGGQNE